MVKDLVLQTEDGRFLSVPESQKIHQIPYFQDGAIVKVSSRNPEMKKK